MADQLALTVAVSGLRHRGSSLTGPLWPLATDALRVVELEPLCAILWAWAALNDLCVIRAAAVITSRWPQRQGNDTSGFPNMSSA
jgi:hypothetical protein